MDRPIDSTTDRTTRPGFEVKRILVPTDFSEGAQRAMDYAVALAAAHEASIRLVHVLTTFDTEAYGLTDNGAYGEALAKRLEHRIGQLLDEAVEVHAGRGVPIDTVQRRSLATVPAILGEAQAAGADLIVTGSHGRHGFRHLMLGSAAESVVRGASVPVLVVRGTLPGGGPPACRILAPTDFSESANHAVEVAKALAGRDEAALDLLHVVEPIPFPASVSMGSRSIYDYLPELRSHILKALNRLAEDDPSVAVHVRHGHAAHAIVDFAAERGNDLIVMATHGLTGLSRFLIGSVTERVVRAAPCPVLVVHPRPAAPAANSALAQAEQQEVAP